MSKFYKVTNVSCRRLTLTITLQNGEVVEDVLEPDEVCYGLNEHAAKMLEFYLFVGDILLEPADPLPPDRINWLAEGF